MSVLLAVGTVVGPSALAAGRSHAGSFHGGHFHHGHFHRHASVGIFIGAAFWPWYYPFPYYYYSPYYYDPQYYLPDAAGPSSLPPRVEPGEVSPAPVQQPYYWYYCAEANGYYPYVRECPGGWQPVAPQPPPQS
jgi:hypothetical protein